MWYADPVIPDSYSDPIALFEHYFAQAREKETADPTAVTLATVDEKARPACRVVLLKGLSAGGFVFFTSYLGRKASHLAQNPAAALCFYWPVIGVQVRVEGLVDKVSAADSDAYFATRPRGSQLAAWASEQSAPLHSREELALRYAEVEERYRGCDVPRPPFWGGYRLTPERIEFWQAELYRMHDRLVYLREDPAWRSHRLFP